MSHIDLFIVVNSRPFFLNALLAHAIQCFGLYACRKFHLGQNIGTIWLSSVSLQAGAVVLFLWHLTGERPFALQTWTNSDVQKTGSA